MIEEFAKEFWAQRAAATDQSIRWTADAMLAFDVELVRRELRGGESVLDLGSGTGDLSLALLEDVAHVTLVDMIPDFLDRIPADPKITTTVSEISSYAPGERFDVGLLFGVVTHLSEETETASYALLRDLVPNGVVIVKNQCGTEVSLDVDTMSNEFGTRYQARYPLVEEQAERLRASFDSVSIVAYPPEFRKWANSAHAAFICR